MKCFWVITFILILVGCSVENDQSEQQVESKEKISEKVVNRLKYFLEYQVDSMAFPRSMEPFGETRGVPSKDWTSGFFPGSLLYSYQITNDKRYLDHALAWIPSLAKEQTNDRTHDMGFKINCSYGNAYKITGNNRYKDVIVNSAKTLSTRFNKNIGCIKSWDFGGSRWEYPVIIDNMMNLELLFLASEITGDSAFYHMAISHANKTIENHFRPDNSSFHVVDYSPGTGQVINTLTHQGFNKESAWSRGQAWGLYGFTMTYRYSKDERHLAQANKIADFIIKHGNMPEDFIPYWDFDAPGIPDEPRDVSAATIIAAALLELYEYSNKQLYLQTANQILNSLSNSQYMLQTDAKAPFILSKSTGNWPKNDEMSVPISYADYYYLEAIYRKNQLNQ